eukprot:9317945-Pyramimonas_sp.AAC.1
MLSSSGPLEVLSEICWGVSEASGAVLSRSWAVVMPVWGVCFGPSRANLRPRRAYWASLEGIRDGLR